MDLRQPLYTRSPEETEQVAAALAATLTGTERILLVGDLGSGKTTFVRGLVRGLGGDPRQVASPTFVLVHIYVTPRTTVYHMDLYRLDTAADLESAGVLELLEEADLAVIEWAERLPVVPVNSLWVELHILGDTERRIRIRKAE